MASNYPDTLDSFTDKADGFDDVMAAHVNDLQDAVENVQETLGLHPQGIAVDVAARLAAIEESAGGSVATDEIFAAKGDLAAGTGASSAARLPAGIDGQKLVADSIESVGLKWVDDDFGVSITIGDGVNDIEAGMKGWLRVPYDCAIESVALAADYAGTLVMDIWRSNSLAALPDSSMSICSSAKPSLSGMQLVEDTALTGWSVELRKGDVLAVNVDSASGIKLVLLAIAGRKVALV